MGEREGKTKQAPDREELPSSGPSPPAATVSRGCVPGCALRGSGCGGGGSGSLRRAPMRAGPHVTAGGVAPVPAGIGRLPPWRGVWKREGISPTGSGPRGGGRVTRTAILEGHGRSWGRMRPLRVPRTAPDPSVRRHRCTVGGVRPPLGEGYGFLLCGPC